MESTGSYQNRLEDLNRLAERIEERRSELAEAAALDAGFPVKVTAQEIGLALQHLRSMEEEIPQAPGGRPYGTVAAIFPYDASPIMLARMGGSAILTGNRLRFSFSSFTQRTARVIADISSPFEALEPLVGQNNREFGSRCVNDPSVRVLFISGGSEVGEVYRSRHRAFDKLFFAGPGGMPAAAVFEGADIEAASRFIARRAFVNGGQYCTTLKKALIHSSIYEAVRDRVLESVRTMKVGDPLEADTEIGPIRVERTRRIVRNAIDKCEGARMLTGSMEGEFIHPLVLEMDSIPDLELFGPFLALKPFDNPAEAVRELIQTRYGFILTFFGSPPHGAGELFQSHFGMVHDNPDFLFRPMRLPFGGKKASGWILERKGDRWYERDGAFLYSRELVREEPV
jgi:acyl-CoA reductase-like NAD-dependent aldehyde dehydrogenase